MKNFGYLCAILLAGCVFQEEKPPVGSDDLGRDSATNPTDMEQTDLRRPVDMRRDDDLGRVDVGPGDVGPTDLGRPDIGEDMPAGPQPYLVSARHTIGLGGTPSVMEPAEIAAMSNGFLIGFTDNLTDRAIFGWYSSDSTDVQATADFPTDHLALDVVSTSEAGYGVFMGETNLYAARFVPSTVGMPTMTSELFEQTSTSLNREIVAGVEADTAYTLMSVEFSGNNAVLQVGLVDETGWGFASTADLQAYPVTDIELVGGQRGNGRRLLGAGVVASRYQLNDYVFDINVAPDWSIDSYACGSAPNQARIVPVRGRWVASKFGSANGAALGLTQCVALGETVSNRVDLVVPTSDPVTDFDLAKEDLADGQEFGIAWLEGMTPMFAEVFLDDVTGTATLSEPFVLSPLTGRRVRAAYNPARQQWGVLVTSINGAELVILERNPDFP